MPSNVFDQLRAGVAEEPTIPGAVARLLQNVAGAMQNLEPPAVASLADVLGTRGDELGRLVMVNTPMIVGTHPPEDGSSGGDQPKPPSVIEKLDDHGEALDGIRSMLQRLQSDVQDLKAKVAPRLVPKPPPPPPPPEHDEGQGE